MFVIHHYYHGYPVHTMEIRQACRSEISLRHVRNHSVNRSRGRITAEKIDLNDDEVPVQMLLQIIPTYAY